MITPKTLDPISFKALKEKQRSLRDGFPETLGLRAHRAISWFGRAEAETDDHDVRFVLLWIGFNAGYASDIDSETTSERNAFKAFFASLVQLDGTHRIYDAVWARFSQEIRLLLNNKYVFGPFWHYQNGIPGFEEWEKRLSASQQLIASAITSFDTSTILAIVFDRLYVLRNQIIHGGATWNSSINRRQVKEGAAVLSWLLPIFIEIMMDNPSHGWGRPFYPVVKE